MRSNTTRISCDWEDCNKVFNLPDPPEKPSDGIEEVIEIMFAEGRRFHFCGMRHLLQFGVEYLKSASRHEDKAHKAMEELEDLPQTAGNFSLKDI